MRTSALKKILPAVVLIVFIVAAILVYALGPWRINASREAAAAEGAAAATSTPAPLVIGSVESATSSTRAVPAGSLEFDSATFGFSVIYPDDLSVHTYDEGGGAATITFQDVAASKGFQIFVVPYAEKQVTPQRFREDEPSGVQQGLKNVTIDGATAASFYSTNVALGDTAEIWFIHGGYLYEVTTLKPLASWLSNIMQTWQFAN